MANTYVAVAFGSSSTDQVMTSPDAVTWTAVSSPFGSAFGAACIATDGAGTFVAIGVATDNITAISAISTDSGATWTQNSIPSTEAPLFPWYYALVYHGGQYVAISFNAQVSANLVAAVSPDGITWSSSTVPVIQGQGCTDVAYGVGIYVAAISGDVTGSFNLHAATSPDGVTWTQQDMGFDQPLQAICYGGGQFVAVGQLGGGIGAVISAATSPDGVTWTQQTSGVPNQNWNAVAYGAGLYVAMANDTGGLTMTSSDGITWTSHSVPAAINVSRLRFINGQFVACLIDFTSSGLVILTSPDGLAWTQRTGALADWIWDVAFSGGAPPPATFNNVWDGMTQQAAGNCLG